MQKLYSKSLQLLVILSLFFSTGCKKDKDATSDSEDIGVEINGIIWATRNVDMPGKFAAKPENAGMFYQWNRKVGWSSTNPLINSDGDSTWIWIQTIGNSWEKANDPCPEGWRVPTHEEQASLVASGSEWTRLNGVRGYYFGSGEATVFFPAAGTRSYDWGTLYDVGEFGGYWSGTLYPHTGGYQTAYFIMNNKTNSYLPANGCSVRCVKE
jgi:uncharacterized protein (TIGR02145 family)